MVAPPATLPITPGSWPEAITTQGTPPFTAPMAASILACMPPRPWADLSPMAGQYSRRYSDTCFASGW